MGNKNPYYNASGYPDPTAYNALKPIIKEEKENKELEKKAKNLIAVFRLIADWAGFDIVGKIHLKHRKSKKEFK
jgi:hypothetical protein